MRRRLSGGLQRTYDTRGEDQGGPSRLGFHQFYLTREPSLAAAATRLEALGLGMTMGQVIQGTLVAYAVEMDVDPRLFTRASQADRTEMWVLSGQEAETLKAVSSAQADPEWRLRATRGGLTLVGVADLRPGSPFNVTLACYRGTPGALLLEISSPVPSRAWDSVATQMLERAVVFSAAPVDSERGPYEDLSRQPFQTVAGRIQSRITIEGRALHTLRSRGLKLSYMASSGLYSVLPTFALSSREVGETVDVLLRNCPGP